MKGAMKGAEVDRYRTTSQAKEDVFAFKITRVTQVQTRVFNSATLKNVRDDGLITFSSA